MWADFLIAIGIAVLLGVGVSVLVRRLGGVAGLERRRARSEAAAAESRHDVLSETEQEHVEAIHELVERARTDEHPVVSLPAGNPLDSFWRLPGVEAEDTPLFDETVSHLLKPVPTWDELEFTRDVWNGGMSAEGLAAAVAEYKAGARS